MELTWIEDFLALASTRNFTLAAAQCATTQPAFSRRLRRLEDWLGCQLVDRDSRPVILTAQGEAFLPRAKRMREDMLDARRLTRALSSHYQAPVRIYTTNTIAIGFFPSLVKRGDLKNYSLVVASVSACLDAVREGRASSALVPLFSSSPLPSCFRTAVAGEDRLVLLARPDVAPLITVRNGKLSGPLLMYAPLTAYGAEVSAILSQAGLVLDEPPVCESASAEALAAQVEAGLGAAWLPQSIAPKGLTPCALQQELSSSYLFALVTFPSDNDGVDSGSSA